MPDLSVLHIIQTPPDFVGGPATYVRELSKHLSMKGVKVGIVAPKPRKFDNEIRSLSENYRFEFYFVDPGIFTSLIRMPWFFSVKAHKLISSIVRNYDVVNIHVESAFLQLVTNTFNSVRVVATIHGIYPYEDIEVLKHEPLNTYRLFRLPFVTPQHCITIREHIKRNGIIIAIAEFIARIIRNMFRPSENLVHVIPNSVNTDIFKNINREQALTIVNKVLVKKGLKQLSEDENIVLFVGRLEPRKGLHLLVKGLAQMNFKSWKLLIIGAGSTSYENYVKNLSIKLGLAEKVLFIGKVPYSTLPHFYSIAQVYVLPSMFEGLPTTILEAMACGTPVIATKIAGIPEVISNGYNGLLLNSLSESEIAKLVEEILTNPSLRNKLSQEAFKTILEKYSWKASVSKYIKLLELSK